MEILHQKHTQDDPLTRRNIRWAILGTSFISTVMVDAIRKSDAGIVHCIAGRSLDKLESFASKYGIAVRYSSYEEAINDPLVDVVYIGLPTFLHCAWIMKCASVGKHILCDKSLTINSVQARRAINYVQGRSVFLMEAQMHRCHPIIARLKACVDSCPVGNVVSVSATFTAPIIDLFNRHAGGSILDLGCYPISLLRLLFGEPVSITGSAQIIQPIVYEHNNFDAVSTAHMLFLNEVFADVRVANNEPLAWEFMIRCERGTISLSNLWDDTVLDEIIVVECESSGDVNRVLNRISEVMPKSFYTLEVDIVNSCISRNMIEAPTPAMSWQDSIENMATLDRWRQAVGLRYPMDDEKEDL